MVWKITKSSKKIFESSELRSVGEDRFVPKTNSHEILNFPQDFCMKKELEIPHWLNIV